MTGDRVEDDAPPPMGWVSRVAIGVGWAIAIALAAVLASWFTMAWLLGHYAPD